MTGTVGRWEGICAGCGGPVSGFADPRADSVADVPEAGEAALCLACLCFGANVGQVDWRRVREEAEEAFALAGVPLLVKRELAEA